MKIEEVKGNCGMRPEPRRVQGCPALHVVQGGLRIENSLAEKRGNRIINRKISKTFATEGTEATEVSGSKINGQIQTAGEAYLSPEPWKTQFILSIDTSVLSVSSVAKQFQNKEYFGGKI